MSTPKRLKPPPLKLKGLSTPPENDSNARPSFYSEESTRITALSDEDRARLFNQTNTVGAASAHDEAHAQTPLASPVAAPPPIAPGGSLGDLGAPSQPKSPPTVSRMTPSSAPRPAPYSAPQVTQEPEGQVGGGLEVSAPPYAHEPPVNGSQGSPATLTPDFMAGAGAQADRSQVVVVFNVRGGVGASTLAVNVAGAAQLYNRRVALIDLDLQLGALSSMLADDGKGLERSLAELVMEVSEAPRPEIRSAIDERSGLSLIAQDGRINEIGLVTPDRLPKFFEAVKAQHDLVVIDGVRSFSDHAVTAMDCADKILLVMTQDIPAFRSARKVISLMKRLDYGQGKVQLIVNRHQKRGMLSIDEIEEYLDYPVTESLPNDFKFASSLIEQGALAHDVKLKHPVTAGYDRLARRILSLEVSPAKRGLFAQLFSSKRS